MALRINGKINVKDGKMAYCSSEMDNGKYIYDVFLCFMDTIEIFVTIDNIALRLDNDKKDRLTHQINSMFKWRLLCAGYIIQYVK